MRFKDRYDAAEQLVPHLMHFFEDPLAIVIALPRGGVLVGATLADKLHLPLDVICPRKITSTDQPEYALGAITESGTAILNLHAMRSLNISKEDLSEEINKQQQEAIRRLHLYRQNKPKRLLKGKHVLIVDDGLATGFTMEAAVKTAHEEGAAKIILIVPVAPPSSLKRFSSQVDEIICPLQDSAFLAVGHYYHDFSQVSDEDVIYALHHRNS